MIRSGGRRRKQIEGRMRLFCEMEKGGMEVLFGGN
jgi:hypothetical protein